MEDVLAGLRAKGYAPETNDDVGGFEPINGTYVARITEAGRKSGESKRTGNPFDFRTIKLQVVETIKGDKATNRFLDLTYNPDEKGMQRLLNDLFTAGIEVTAKDDAEMDTFLHTLTDKTMYIRAWVWKPEKDRDGNLIPEDQRVGRQQSKVIKSAGTGNKPSAAKSDVPF